MSDPVAKYKFISEFTNKPPSLGDKNNYSVISPPKSPAPNLPGVGDTVQVSQPVTGTGSITVGNWLGGFNLSGATFKPNRCSRSITDLLFRS
jgi:hypothetical protein